MACEVVVRGTEPLVSSTASESKQHSDLSVEAGLTATQKTAWILMEIFSTSSVRFFFAS